MQNTMQTAAILASLLLVPLSGMAQERSKGTAVIRVTDDEYRIPIECDDPARPGLGFSTEPSRITRETKGRASMVNLRVRPWKDTGDVVVTLDRYVAWIQPPPSASGVMSARLDMSPASMVRDNMPVALTYDMWNDGDRPPGLNGVQFEANCGFRDPEAPSYRKLSGPDTPSP